MSSAAQSPGREGYESGRRSRKALLDATLNVLAEDGVRAVTHRRINADAGVAHGMTTYHFSTKHQMLAAAYEHWVERTLERTREIASSLAERAGEGGRIEAAVEALVEVTLGELETGHAAAGFALAREPSLAEDFGRSEKRILALIEGESRELGSDDPRQDAWIILSTIRGLQLAHLSGAGGRLTRAALRATFSRLVESLSLHSQTEAKS